MRRCRGGGDEEEEEGEEKEEEEGEEEEQWRREGLSLHSLPHHLYMGLNHSQCTPCPTPSLPLPRPPAAGPVQAFSAAPPVAWGAQSGCGLERGGRSCGSGQE